jgi:hypothetical protein
MSLESQIADLVSATNALVTNFNAKKSSIDTAVAAAIAAVPIMVRTYYVDQIAGDDTSVGTQALPLKTIEKALSNTPAGGLCTVVLINDYTMSGTITTDKQMLHIKSLVSTVKKKLNTPYYVQDDIAKLPGITFATGGVVMLTDITLTLPSIAGVPVPQPFYNAFFKTGSVAGIPMMTVKFSRSEVLQAADATATLFVQLSSAVTFMVTETTFPAGFGGRYISGVASGTNPTALSTVVTNLGTL